MDSYENFCEKDFQVNVFLENKYFTWDYYRDNDTEIWFKGGIFIEDKYITASEIPELLLDALSPEKDCLSIKSFLLSLNGNFSFVIKKPEYTYVVADRIRSIPLLFFACDDFITISDNTDIFREAYDLTKDESGFAEFLAAGFVSGRNTLFKEISQLQAGEYLFIDSGKKNIEAETYFSFSHGNICPAGEDMLIEALDDIYIRCFKRLVQSVENEGKKIVVPLSSGLDSRIIVSMLKYLGVDDVICFSYGWRNSPEAKISREVAEKLGYKWYFVDYSPDLLYESYHSEDMSDYMKYAGNFASLPYTQDFLALNILKKEGKIPANACIVPGHTGMISGGRIPNDYAYEGNYDEKRFISDNMIWHYNLWKWSGKNDLDFRRILEEKSLESTNYPEIYDKDTCADAVELFDYKERQVKYVINSVRLYEYFGYSWKLPLVDSEAVDFFLRVPLDQRIGRRLYKNYAREILFKRSVPGFADIKCTTNLYHQDIREKLEKSIFEKIVQTYLTSNKMHQFIPYCLFKRPVLSEMKFRIFGIKADDLNQTLIGNIIENNNKAIISKAYGYMTYLYLKDIVLSYSSGEIAD